MFALPHYSHVASAIAVALVVSISAAQAQYAPPTSPSCACGPSAMPAYVPAPQPAVRPLDYSPRSTSGVTSVGSGVSVRDGANYRPARTDLGASGSQTYSGPALWSGAYAGLQGGFSSGTAHINDPDLGDMANRGWFGGAHVGYLAQRGAIVFGIEGDFDLSRASGHKAFPSGLDAMSDRNWTASVRGRLGYAFGNAMIYGTAGAALAEHEVTVAAGSLKTSGKTMFPGFVIGGGLDWKVMNNVSLRGEVLHYRYGSRNIDFSGYAVPTKIDETVVRAGVSYHFN
jgi:outer membrane immunogenic protein